MLTDAAHAAGRRLSLLAAQAHGPERAALHGVASPEAPTTPVGRRLQLGLAAAAVFLVFFQGQVVPPLVPTLAAAFDTPAHLVGLLATAYALPYGVVALVYGPLSDRLGRRAVIALCLAGVAVSALGAALASSFDLLVATRVLAGLSAGGVMPVALAYAADLYAYRERGRAIGVVFAALTYGQGVGMSVGPMLEPWIGWRPLFGAVAVITASLVALALVSPRQVTAPTATPSGPSAVARGYLALLSLPRGWRIYTLLVLTGLCSSGLSAWFGVFLHERYGLVGLGIGLAYLAYAAVGSLSPLTGALADRMGRGRLIALGFGAGALGALLLALQGPLPLTLVGIAAVALGLQLTYPLLAGLASELAPGARGVALGLNTFSMYMGVGWGSLAVGSLLPFGFTAAFAIVAVVSGLGAIWAALAVRRER